MIRLERLHDALKRGVRPATWIAGDEPLLVLEAADAVRAAARAAGWSERVVHTVDRGFRFEALAADAATGSLFGDRKLIELRLPARPTQEFGQSFAQLAAQLADDVRLLVSSARLDRKTTDSAWFEAIDALGLVVTVPTIERGALPQWLAARLASQGQRTEPAVLELIAERVEGNLVAAAQELRKLALLFPQGPLPADEVRAAVLDVARYDVFDAVDAALAGDANRALRSLHGLRAEGTAAPVVLWAIAEAARALLKLSGSAATPQAMSQLRIWGERQRVYSAALRRLSPRALRLLLRQAARTDRIVKGVAPGDEWQALESLVLRLCAVPVAMEAQ
ncbi:MAG TPA: DNA polymerase III subunit delta [Burkholderiaceae bacterium]|nr:DNA polymerase III subunit delta [Burkholderiaceae bacterium]